MRPHIRFSAWNKWAGIRSSYISDTRKIIGATETPADVTDFNISMVGSNQMQLSWTPVEDLDIEFYEIRYSTGVALQNGLIQLT